MKTLVILIVLLGTGCAHMQPIHHRTVVMHDGTQLECVTYLSTISCDWEGRGRIE